MAAKGVRRGFDRKNGAKGEQEGCRRKNSQGLRGH